jgi:hypothetical protein
MRLEDNKNSDCRGDGFVALFTHDGDDCIVPTNDNIR